VADPVRQATGRIGAHILHATHDSRELTVAARAKFFEKFLNQVDPDRILPEGERLRRAEHALRAHMLKLAYRSAKARRERKARMEAEGGES
jgi:hypothetical protein